jgi:phosphonatase-like hydrolase
MNVELAIFDIAGTTVHDESHVSLCLQDALAAAGHEFSVREITPLMGIPKPVAIQTLFDSRGVQGDPKAINEDFVRRMVEVYRTNPEIRPIEGAEETFCKLHEHGIRVALDTGFDRTVTQVILERLKWDDSVIDGSVTCSEVARGRPNPDMIHWLMEQFGVQDPKRVAKIGDTPSDLHEGTNAGCAWVIGVCGGTHSRDELAVHPHTHLVETVADVPEILIGQPANVGH